MLHMLIDFEWFPSRILEKIRANKNASLVQPYSHQNSLVQGAEKVRRHRKNKMTFAPGNGFKQNFQHY